MEVCARPWHRPRKGLLGNLEDSPMTNVASLTSAAGIMTALIFSFAFIRRFMRTSHVQSWIDSEIIAYAIAFVLTVMFAMSIAYLGKSLTAIIPHIGISTVLSFALHLATWSVVRKLLPIRVEAPPMAPTAA
jgi:hypothetical protein